jgi:hypothetical protein
MNKIGHFEVYLLNTKTTGTPPARCIDPDYSFPVTALEVAFTGGHKVNISINSDGDLEALFTTKADRDLKNYFWLYVSGGYKLKSVTMTEIASVDPTTCEFGGGHRSLITVHQSVSPNPIPHAKR